MKEIQQKISENERKIRDCEGCFDEIKLKQQSPKMPDWLMGWVDSEKKRPWPPMQE